MENIILYWCEVWKSKTGRKHMKLAQIQRLCIEHSLRSPRWCWQVCCRLGILLVSLKQSISVKDLCVALMCSGIFSPQVICPSQVATRWICFFRFRQTSTNWQYMGDILWNISNRGKLRQFSDSLSFVFAIRNTYFQLHSWDMKQRNELDIIAVKKFLSYSFKLVYFL